MGAVSEAKAIEREVPVGERLVAGLRVAWPSQPKNVASTGLAADLIPTNKGPSDSYLSWYLIVTDRGLGLSVQRGGIKGIVRLKQTAWVPLDQMIDIEELSTNHGDRVVRLTFADGSQIALFPRANSAKVVTALQPIASAYRARHLESQLSPTTNEDAGMSSLLAEHSGSGETLRDLSQRWMDAQRATAGRSAVEPITDVNDGPAHIAEQAGHPWLRAFGVLSWGVGFYVIAIVLALAMIATPYLEWRFLDRLHFQLLVVALAGLGVLAGLWPRRISWEAPGPIVSRDDGPELWTLVDELAREAKTQPPSVIYCVPEVNAFVTERGGIFGFRRTRIMGVGFPLLMMLSVNELRAVLAHEFGHYVGGDTRVGRMVYRLRDVIGRSAQQSRSNAVGVVFDWYAERFVRASATVSRRQELAADRLAGDLVGQRAIASALVKIARGSVVWNAFLYRVYSPTIDGGVEMEIGDGLQRMLANPSTTVAIDQLETELINRVPSQYDSHPPTSIRLAALRPMSSPSARSEEPAESLLDKPSEVRARTLPFLLSSSALANGRTVATWEDWPKVIESALRRRCSPYAHLLAKFAVDALPRDPGQLSLVAREVRQTYGSDGLSAATALFRDAMALELRACGWEFASDPAPVVVMEKGDLHFDMSWVSEFLAGELDETTWRRLCADAGLGERRFASAIEGS